MLDLSTRTLTEKNEKAQLKLRPIVPSTYQGLSKVHGSDVTVEVLAMSAGPRNEPTEREGTLRRLAHAVDDPVCKS